MKLVKTDLSLPEVKERLQKKDAFKKKRSDKDLTEKERKMFESLYPMTPDEELAKKFLISKDDVKRLAYNLGVYKDSAFTRHQMVVAKNDTMVVGKDGAPSTPGYLLSAMTKKWTEEERRELMIYYEEGMKPREMLQELAMAQMIRIQRGTSYEDDKGALFRVVNDAIDSLHAILKTLNEMENGINVNHEISFDKMVLRSQGKL
jgi:hypothetical protein